jgi:hypothetical protein
MRKPKEAPAPEQTTAPERAAALEPMESTAQAEDAGELQAPPGETESADPATQELPPIEPPRSWSKEDKELFARLPRETQERLADRERSRDSDFSRRQQEATERAKALEAERRQVEQARQQYEAALPQLLTVLQQQQAGEFADIRTVADVERLVREDGPRYLQWDLHQKKVAAVQQEVAAAQQRQAQELGQLWQQFASEQDKLVTEKVPELADAKKAAELQSSALSTLKNIGFDQEELARAWQGQQGLSLRDHRLQMLILDATRWREAQAKAKSVAAKPVPPVQRPGVAQGRNAAREAELQNLTHKLERTGSLRDAAALLRASRAARR